MATFDYTTSPEDVRQAQDLGLSQTVLRWRVDFSTAGDATGLAQTETAKIGVIPAGFVLHSFGAISRTAEGAATTADFGDTTDPDGLGDGLDMNTTAGTQIALAGTEAYGVGKYFGSDTDLIVTGAGATTIDGAVIDVWMTGHIAPTS